MLSFDEPSHTYRWNGTVAPGVTTIIKPLETSFFCTPEQLERARQEGKAIHKMVELHCRNKLDIDELPLWLKPHLKAWEKFIAETGFKLWQSEHRLYNEVYGYAGTLDLAGVLTKKKHAPRSAIIDIKRTLTGAPAVGVQLAGYKDGWNRAALGRAEWADLRFGLQLRPSGEYRLEPFESPDDFPAFLACLTIKRWKEKNR